jgi:hypothetical protein
MGCKAVSRWFHRGQGSSTDRFGWKAIPFALDDFDSNYDKVSQARLWAHRVHTFVSMFGEDCILERKGCYCIVWYTFATDG